VSVRTWPGYAPLLTPPELAPSISVIGKFGIGLGDAAAVAAARLARADHLRDGHHVIAVVPQHRDELLNQIDCG
jgi:hypothetical protein